MQKTFFRNIEEGPEIIFEGQTEFTHIIIKDEGGQRTLYMGEHGEEAETSICLRDPEAPIFEYPGMMLASLALNPGGGNIIMLGLGGGFIPGLFQKYLPQYNLTVVEIDPMVADLASVYFGFDPGLNVELVIADGRKYIESLPLSSIDQIWLDAFGGDYIPSHLLEKSFLESCRARLTSDGTLVQNLHQSRPHIYRAQTLTTKEVFNQLIALDGTRCGNTIIMASNTPRPFPQNAQIFKKRLQAIPEKIAGYNLLAETQKLRKL